MSRPALGDEPRDLFRRRCPRCQQEKPLGAFPRNRSRPDGRGAYCLPCHRERGAEYRSTPEGAAAHRASQRRAAAKMREKFEAELAKLTPEQRDAYGLD